MPAQLQHYVPQFLLRNFTESGRIHVYDKWERRSFGTNPRNVAAERGFYDLEVETGEAASLERLLGRVEGNAASAINEILEREAIGFLAPHQRGAIAVFVAVQFMRVRAMRELYKDMSQKLVERLSEMAGPDAELPPDVVPATDDDAKLMGMKLMLDAPNSLGPILLSMGWLLFEAPTDAPFWISDNPITRHNTKHQDSPYGNLGFGSEGIEVYLPLSPRFSLAFFCRTTRDEVVEGLQKALVVRDVFGSQAFDTERMGYMADGFRYGYPVPSHPENVEFANSIQVSGAERWVFGQTGDFALADVMLDDNPDLKIGNRMSVE